MEHLAAEDADAVILQEEFLQVGGRLEDNTLYFKFFRLTGKVIYRVASNRKKVPSVRFSKKNFYWVFRFPIFSLSFHKKSNTTLKGPESLFQTSMAK